MQTLPPAVDTNRSVKSLMMPAHDLAPATQTTRLPRVPTPSGPQYSTVWTTDGRFVTGGMAEIAGNGNGWSATLDRLDRPGHVASMYFASGVREVLLRLDDGRSARARITGTSFIAASERICTLAGLEQLA